jgi:hypothetical protein
MEFEQTQVEQEDETRRVTAKPAGTPSSNRAKLAILKTRATTNLPSVHIRTITTSSNEEEVTAKCDAMSNETDSYRKVVDDY